MNTRGWGLRKMLLLTAIIVLALVLIGTLIVMNFNNLDLSDPKRDDENYLKADSYQEIESLMINATIENNSQNKESYVITLKTLENKDLIENVYELEEYETKCSGYVKVNPSTSIYSAYLKCGNIYETAGYDSTLDQ